VTHLPSLPPNASLLDVFKTFPETSKPLIEFHEALLRGPSPFSEMERELIAAYVSGLNHCCYCHGVHTAVAERLGAPAGIASRLVESFDLAAAPEKLRPVLRYAQKLTRDPAGITHADAQAIFAAGWNETALYHTVAVTALFNLMNRLVEGLGIALDPAYAQGAAQRLADRGYSSLLALISRPA
jgi:uncharacterized peroxidase-related enzyme